MARSFVIALLLITAWGSLLTNRQILLDHFSGKSPSMIQTKQDVITDILPEEEVTDVAEEDSAVPEATEEQETRVAGQESHDGMVCVCMSSDEVDFKELDGDENGEDDEVDVEVDEDYYMNEDGSPFEDESECEEAVEITLECSGNDCVVTDSSDSINFEIQTVSLDECLDEIDLVVVDQIEEGECDISDVTIVCTDGVCVVTDNLGEDCENVSVECDGDECTVIT